MLPELTTSSALYYSLLACCLLLGTGLMVLAWQRPRTRQRGLRVLACGVAAGALWLTAFPPLRQLPAAQAEAILLTDGYSPDTLRQLLRQLGAGTQTWVYGNVKAPTKARPLTSLLTLAEQKPALRRLHVLGTGLPAAELPLLRNIPLSIHAGQPFAGFTTAYWPAKLTLGGTLLVEGTVAKASISSAGPAAWVVLHADGAGRDSVPLPKGGGSFRLHYRPKATGLTQYELQLRRPGQGLISEPLPLEITESARPTVLLLVATPSFEFKFLKNYLAEAHYPVALRTSISRGLVQTDFVNQPTLPLDHLTPALLAHYAIVIADAATIAALSGPEAQALQTAISAGRLGLITLAEAAPLPSTALARADFGVQPRTTAPATAAPVPVNWPDAPGAVQASLPAQLRASAALRSLITGPAGLLLAARRRVGLGQVAVSVVPETFRWGLQGHSSEYASFWTRLLAAVAPPPPVAAAWHTGTRWPRPHLPLTLHLAGALPGSAPTVTPLAGGPTIHLALRQDTRLPEWSTAQFWPLAAGWQAVQGPGRAVYHFYVYPAGAWAGPELLERQQALASYNASIAKASATAPAAVMITESWPTGWFFGLFLLAAGYLWLEEKL